MGPPRFLGDISSLKDVFREAKKLPGSRMLVAKVAHLWWEQLQKGRHVPGPYPKYCQCFVGNVVACQCLNPSLFIEWMIDNMIEWHALPTFCVGDRLLQPLFWTLFSQLENMPYRFPLGGLRKLLIDEVFCGWARKPHSALRVKRVPGRDLVANSCQCSKIQELDRTCWILFVWIGNKGNIGHSACILLFLFVMPGNLSGSSCQC